MGRRRARGAVEGAHRFHSPADEAARLGVSDTLILEACKTGSYPHRRLGRRVLIDPAEGDAYLATVGVSVAQAVKNTGEMGGIATALVTGSNGEDCR